MSEKKQKPKGNYAVMASRNEPPDGLDDFPTPPWATRALLEQPFMQYNLENRVCWEPACGRGHMAEVLRSSRCRDLLVSDVHDYGYRSTVKLPFSLADKRVDWVITNPPFRLGNEFAAQALKISRMGVALLARTQFIETIGRYNTLFRDNPPSYFCPFVERVPMVKGRLSRTAVTATSYAWFVWMMGGGARFSLLHLIPPCRKRLEQPSDYEPAFLEGRRHTS